MPHVTFIHGLSNKPKHETLHEIWRRKLATGNTGLNLGSKGVTTRMVYWADVLYPEPDKDVADYESATDRVAREVDGGGNAQVPAAQTSEEAAYLEAARARMAATPEAEIEAKAAAEQATPFPVTESALDDEPTPGPAPITLERIPLPWFIKKRIMATYVRDAYLYQFDKKFSPRPGVEYEVRKEIRKRFIEALTDPKITHPHVVVSHSMGTMVAYDCLKRVGDCAGVDALMTLGSPLGVDEVQDRFKPEWTRNDGYPSIKLTGDWVNVYDPYDVVCAADPRLAGDYRHGGKDRIKDVKVENDGAWRHSIAKYFQRDEARAELRRLLDLK